MTGVTATKSNVFVANLRYWVAGFSLLMMLLVVALLTVRGYEGKMTGQLSTANAVCLILGALCLGNVARILLGRRHQWAGWVAPAVLVFALAGVAAGQLSSSGSAAAIWLTALGAETLSMLWIARPKVNQESDGLEAFSIDPMSSTENSTLADDSGDDAAGEDHSAKVDEAAPTDNLGAAATGGEIDSEGTEESDDESVTQQMTRSLKPDGTEIFAGRVRVDFRPQEKQSSAHLAFTPPLRSVPEVFVEQSSGPAAEVNPGSVYAHGVRVDVRLDSIPDEAVYVWFEIYVVAPQNGQAAAAS